MTTRKRQQKSNPTIIIQARMGSTRLPGKCAMSVFKDETLLDHLLNRITKGCINNYNILVGTPPDLITQKPIHDICRKHNVTVFIGSEDDVLARYYYGAKKYNADPIIRITSDCPMLDPSLIDEAYAYYCTCNVEYFTNAHSRDDYHGYPSGFNVEIISFKLLEQLHQEVNEPDLREHVTKALTVEKYKKKLWLSSMELCLPISYPELKLSVDTAEDLDRVRSIVATLYPLKELYTYEEVIACALSKGLIDAERKKK